MNDIEREIGNFGSQRSKQQSTVRTRWWQSPHIIQHINYRICGEMLEGRNEGAINILQKKYGNRTFNRAISIGSGSADKEMYLIEKGIVKNFICYELSEERIKQGKMLAEQKHINDKIIFHLGNFFESEDNKPETFDFIFWDNSLHHMLDTFLAVKTSKALLQQGGVCFCNDFVGASRFQWSDLELAIVNGVRASLPDDIFIINGKMSNKFIGRPNLEDMIKIDYSEAADSDNILPAIKSVFESPLIINVGGIIYHVCLNDILQNIPEHSKLLDDLLKLDDEVAEHGFQQYAFILAEKY